jgi:hypothetical protein
VQWCHFLSVVINVFAAGEAAQLKSTDDADPDQALFTEVVGQVLAETTAAPAATKTVLVEPKAHVVDLLAQKKDLEALVAARKERNAALRAKIAMLAADVGLEVGSDLATNAASASSFADLAQVRLHDGPTTWSDGAIYPEVLFGDMAEITLMAEKQLAAAELTDGHRPVDRATSGSGRERQKEQEARETTEKEADVPGLAQMKMASHPGLQHMLREIPEAGLFAEEYVYGVALYWWPRTVDTSLDEYFQEYVETARPVGPVYRDAGEEVMATCCSKNAPGLLHAFDAGISFPPPKSRIVFTQVPSKEYSFGIGDQPTLTLNSMWGPYYRETLGFQVTQSARAHTYYSSKQIQKSCS